MKCFQESRRRGATFAGVSISRPSRADNNHEVSVREHHAFANFIRRMALSYVDAGYTVIIVGLCGMWQKYQRHT